MELHELLTMSVKQMTVMPAIYVVAIIPHHALPTEPRALLTISANQTIVMYVMYVVVMDLPAL